MEPNLDTISLEEFMKTELKIGIVTLVRPHSNADKLMVLEVDIGGKVITAA
jgi:tRNA-binding EMAP/Myf-like protein